MPYIEREYLTEQFEDLLHNDNIMNPVIKVLDGLKIIDTAPSADVVKVVRCGQCGNYCKNTGECNLYGRHPNENDFCSSGIKEREDNC